MMASDMKMVKSMLVGAMSLPPTARRPDSALQDSRNNSSNCLGYGLGIVGVHDSR